MVDIKLADSAGFCFGVKRAVDETIRIQEENNKKIYTLGPLIHNGDVVKYLESKNVFAITMEEALSLEKDEIIVIRSHGVPKSVIDDLKSKELKIINATCPYVTNIQKKVNKYYGNGYKIVILGDKDHPEVKGINGWCGDDAIITADGTFKEDIPKGKLCIVSQTTEKQENWQKTIGSVAERSKEFVAFNTICSATEVRQKSAMKISQSSDIMIVVGGKNSSNTTKLYEICKNNCENTFHVENSSEIDLEKIQTIKHDKIGVTAGASTPDWIIQEVIDKLKSNIK